MKKRIPAVILMFSLFLTGAFAANTYQKSINVEYGINLFIEGNSPTLTDVNGKTVQPFVYDGTTYVPIRAVAESLGASIQYDSSTNTASVYNDAVRSAQYAFMMKSTLDDMYVEMLGLRDDIALDMLDLNYRSKQYDILSTEYNSIKSMSDIYEDWNNELVIEVNNTAFSDFSSLYDTYTRAYKYYEKFCRDGQSYNAQSVFTYFDECIDYYFDAKAAIEDFFMEP